jgi:hypothetical protein
LRLRCTGKIEIGLEHVPKKLTDFFDLNMLQVFESERFLFDQMILSAREALEVNFRLFLASMLPPANNFPSIARENDMGGLEDC